MAPARSERSRSVAGRRSDDDFLMKSPAQSAAPYAGDGGLLDSYDAEFAGKDLTIDDNIYGRENGRAPAAAGTTRQLPLRTDAEGRQDEYRKLMAAHEDARQNTNYLHAGTVVPEKYANDWAGFRRSRIDPDNKMETEERDYDNDPSEEGYEADFAWEKSGGERVAPDEGWDKPKVGRFRSAMSWLGNKLTFGKFGGKDYRARQDALAKRRGIMEDAFINQMAYFNEREYDLANPRAPYHELTKQRYGDFYIGKAQRNFTDRSAYQNPRYNDASSWIKASKYGRGKWDRLAAKYAGAKYMNHNLLGD